MNVVFILRKHERTVMKSLSSKHNDYICSLILFLKVFALYGKNSIKSNIQYYITGFCICFNMQFNSAFGYNSIALKGIVHNYDARDKPLQAVNEQKSQHEKTHMFQVFLAEAPRCLSS